MIRHRSGCCSLLVAGGSRVLGLVVVCVVAVVSLRLKQRGFYLSWFFCFFAKDTFSVGLVAVVLVEAMCCSSGSKSL